MAAAGLVDEDDMSNHTGYTNSVNKKSDKADYTWEEICETIHLMEKRLESGQGGPHNAMCRLSLSMSKWLVAEALRLRNVAQNTSALPIVPHPDTPEAEYKEDRMSEDIATKRCCYTCHYFKQITGENWGTCLRYPPAAYPDSADSFPGVTDSSWCGEYKEATLESGRSRKPTQRQK